MEHKVDIWPFNPVSLTSDLQNEWYGTVSKYVSKSEYL